MSRLPGLLRLLSHTTQGNTSHSDLDPPMLIISQTNAPQASLVGHFLNHGSLLKNNYIKLAALERATVFISCDFGRVTFDVTSR